VAEPVSVGSGAPVAAEGEGATLTGRAVHKYAQPTQAGPRNQPRRTPKSKR
jgi:preprotein translocase subunit SecF